MAKKKYEQQTAAIELNRKELINFLKNQEFLKEQLIDKRNNFNYYKKVEKIGAYKLEQK